MWDPTREVATMDSKRPDVRMDETSDQDGLVTDRDSDGRDRQGVRAVLESWLERANGALGRSGAD
ncbi:hypothetical protein EA472_15920 [Natrarchaeobius oligotrophus]|uniref:Uncharacterized protein n=2 Tax=Natrarchaeobius TaxID=2501796 RepID=A0A3N6MDZ8_NATCH|nr:hypothetical protein EA472_15920 [Natrarchaeobius chitinivorans]